MTNIYNNPEYQNPSAKADTFDEAAHNAAMVAKFDRAGGRTNVGGSSAQVDANTGATVHRGQNTTYVSRDRLGSDIIASARRAGNGNPVMGDIGMEDLVTVHGIQMKVSGAVAQGYLTRDASGTIIDPRTVGKR